jgi:hypothetical protein
MLEGNIAKAEKALKDWEHMKPEVSVPLKFILEKTGGGGWGFLFFLFTLPNFVVIPSLPFLPFIAGIPAMYAAYMFARSRDTNNIPERLSDLRIKPKYGIRCLKFARWALFMADATRKPEWIEGRVNQAILGTAAVIMTFLLCLPLPIINVPIAFSTLFLAMGLAGRDGFLSWFAVFCGALSAIFMAWAFLGLASTLGMTP